MTKDQITLLNSLVKKKQELEEVQMDSGVDHSVEIARLGKAIRIAQSWTS